MKILVFSLIAIAVPCWGTNRFPAPVEGTYRFHRLDLPRSSYTHARYIYADTPEKLDYILFLKRQNYRCERYLKVSPNIVCLQPENSVENLPAEQKVNVVNWIGEKFRDMQIDFKEVLGKAETIGGQRVRVHQRVEFDRHTYSSYEIAKGSDGDRLIFNEGGSSEVKQAILLQDDKTILHEERQEVKTTNADSENYRLYLELKRTEI